MDTLLGQHRPLTMLLISFSLLAFLAIVGTLVEFYTHAGTGLFTQAMTYIGVGGPASTGVQSAADAALKWRAASQSLPVKLPVPPPMVTPP